jgi:hypothetical protein
MFIMSLNFSANQRTSNLLPLQVCFVGIERLLETTAATGKCSGLLGPLLVRGPGGLLVPLCLQLPVLRTYDAASDDDNVASLLEDQLARGVVLLAQSVS